MSEKKPLFPSDLSHLRETFRKDLEFLFQQALSESQYQAALKAKELLAKEAGLLSGDGRKLKKSDFLKGGSLTVQDLSDDVLDALIHALSENPDKF
ncbi:MAG: hypothetical protein ACRCYZ_00650 [Alphaproteobacteria bacterium]